ncbi:uncharacterized protein LOC113341411 [Papaver somniferum]|uniref:uncharacterized protein LOC113341411 n=1 Tax=Papaver somniferum TaxID=3469 RepID=UPI000E6F7E0A|nr:uncharacterized protein LOC113341411 [Papaver somniferum]
MNDFDKRVSVKNTIVAQRCAVCLIQETKIQFMSHWFARQLWYDDNFDWFYIPSVGSSGGLLTIWDSSRFEKLDERLGFNNIASVFSTRVNGFKWAVVDAYSPCEHTCEYNSRTDFWVDMDATRRWWSGPICIAGDMDAVRSGEERNRGVGDRRNTSLLNNFIQEHELIDQPLIGGAFTWSNNQVIPLLCRLDRFLFSHDFEVVFPNALHVVLTRTISDHNPILMISEPVATSKPYFKLDRVWVEHKDFVKNVQQWWGVMNYIGSASSSFFLKLQNLKHLIKPWRLREFGGISRDKAELTGRIQELNILEETGALQHHQLEDRTQCKLKLKSIESMEARKWQLRKKHNDFRWGIQIHVIFIALQVRERSVIRLSSFK